MEESRLLIFLCFYWIATNIHIQYTLWGIWNGIWKCNNLLPKVKDLVQCNGSISLPLLNSANTGQSNSTASCKFVLHAVKLGLIPGILQAMSGVIPEFLNVELKVSREHHQAWSKNKTTYKTKLCKHNFFVKYRCTVLNCLYLLKKECLLAKAQ